MLRRLAGRVARSGARKLRRLGRVAAERLAARLGRGSAGPVAPARESPGAGSQAAPSTAPAVGPGSTTETRSPLPGGQAGLPVLSPPEEAAVGEAASTAGGETPAAARSPAPEESEPPPASFAALDELRSRLRARGRPLVVNHWATWCEGCLDEMPQLSALAARYRGRVDFLGVSWDPFVPWEEGEALLRAVAERAHELGADWPHLVFAGPPEQLFRGLPLEHQTVPQTFLYGPEGVAWHTPELVDDARAAELSARIEELLASWPGDAASEE